MKTHDHNFKNLFLDFPKEALKWFFPKAEETWGKILHVEFIRQEPKKHSLADSSLELDMPILFKLKISNCFYGWWNSRKIRANFPSINYYGIRPI